MQMIGNVCTAVLEIAGTLFIVAVAAVAISFAIYCIRWELR